MSDPRRRRQLLGAILFAALVLLAVLARHAGEDQYDPHGQSSSRGERALVLARATNIVVRAMSYDPGAPSTERAKVERDMTEQMRVEYERMLPSSTDRQKAAGSGAKVAAQVVRAGLVSLTKDEASVLVYVNQRASAKSTTEVLESPTWEVLHLVRRDSQWLLSGMEAPGPLR